MAKTLLAEMGQAKEQMMKWQELGCRPVGDKNICPDCVGDYALERFIAEHAMHTQCDYCGKVFESPICAEVDELIEFIADGISYEYEDTGPSERDKELRHYTRIHRSHLERVARLEGAASERRGTVLMKLHKLKAAI